jgi:uncharacterized protein YkwD
MKNILLLAIVVLFFYSCKESSNPVNTPNDVKNLSNDALLTEINFARTNPKAYASLLRDRLKYFSGKTYDDGTGYKYTTQEGADAYLEAIDYLEKASPVPALSLSSGLCSAAMAHVNDIGPKGLAQHNGTDGSTPSVRMARFGKPSGYLGENISFGLSTARNVVIQFIVDDGISARGHRINVFNSLYKFVGFGSGFHNDYDIMCVHDYAEGYIEKVIL